MPAKKTLGILELLELFPDEESATKWFEDTRWPGGKRHCPHYGMGIIAITRQTLFLNLKVSVYNARSYTSHEEDQTY